MKLLAMSTSTWSLAVAVMEEGKLIGELNTNITKNHSLRLMPAIQSLLEQVDIKPKELEKIAIAHGPGSYTGVRIGMTTAKSLAWSLNIPIAGISSLQVRAQNGYGFKGEIIPMIDARRGQVYTGVYETDEHNQLATNKEEDRLQLVTELLEQLKKSDQALLFLGEGVTQHQQEILNTLGNQAVIAADIDHIPRGARVAYVAWKMWAEQVQETHPIAPEYLQLAEAEKNWLASQKC